MNRFAELIITGSRTAAREEGERIGLSGEALQRFGFAGGEHTVEYEVASDGMATPIKLDGFRLRRDQPARRMLYEACPNSYTYGANGETVHDDEHGCIACVRGFVPIGVTVQQFDKIHAEFHEAHEELDDDPDSPLWSVVDSRARRIDVARDNHAKRRKTFIDDYKAFVEDVRRMREIQVAWAVQTERLIPAQQAELERTVDTTVRQVGNDLGGRR